MRRLYKTIELMFRWLVYTNAQFIKKNNRARCRCEYYRSAIKHYFFVVKKNKFD